MSNMKIAATEGLKSGFKTPVNYEDHRPIIMANLADAHH